MRQVNTAERAGKLDVATQVVTPYLDSLQRRLDALSEIFGTVDGFVTIVNHFFSRKEIAFDPHGGLVIRTSRGDILPPPALSSGERHLLLIFCNSVIALGHPSVIIVDEPEISLNIKWQRALISSLCQCVGDRPVQYVLATHSLETISRYGDCVWKLDAPEK